MIQINADFITCDYEDDDGKRCGKVLTEQEREQDGACADCAEKIWNFIHHIMKETSNG